MNKHSIVAGMVLATLCLPVHSARASCGQAQCSVDPALNARQLVAREVRLELVTEYIEQDQPWVRHHSADVGAILRDDHNEVETTNLTWKLRAEAAVTERWTIGLMLPFVHREHMHLANPAHSDGEAPLYRARHAGDAAAVEDAGVDHEDDDLATIGDATGIPERWDFTRIGDLQLTASYAVLHSNETEGTSLRLFAGLKLPTGETGVRNDEGEEGEITLQPGTGSVDPVFGLTLQRTFSFGSSAALLPVSAGVQVRTEGSDGKFGYRPGTEAIAGVAAQYPLVRRLSALGQLNFRYRDRDHTGDAPGVQAQHTGSEALYLTPGLRFDLTDAAGVYSYVQVPVYQRVNGIQLVSQWNLLVGLTYRFEI